MKTIQPGIHVDALTRILVNGARQERRIGDLKPGDKVGQACSTWYFGVDEIRISKRRQHAYEIKLESGEEVLLAEGTILCGQYGPNLVAKPNDKIICLANLGKFFDATDSRRQFEASFHAPEKLESLVKKICRPQARAALGYSKKFYQWSQMFAFLEKIGHKYPECQIIPGVYASSTYDYTYYDFVAASRDQTGLGDVFLPLFELKQYYDREREQAFFPVVLAFEDGYRMQTRKVVSCKPVISDGPWAFPIFDAYNMSLGSGSHQRFSFSIHGIPVFYPNPFLSDFAIRATLPLENQELLPPAPEEEDEDTPSFDFSEMYEQLRDKPAAEPVPVDAASQIIDAAFESLRRLAASGISEDRLLIEFEKRMEPTESGAEAEPAPAVEGGDKAEQQG